MKKKFFFGKYLIDHSFDFIYAMCFFGLLIFGSEFAEGRNKGGNLIALICCVLFFYGTFVWNKKMKQKTEKNNKKWEELFSH